MGKIKKSLIALGVLALAALTSVTASASLLIEPHVGYNLYGNADYSSITTKYNGAQYGARLGGQFLGLMGGFDFTHSAYTAKSTSASGSSSNDVKRDQFGIFAGYNLPILLRAWVGYYFSDKSSGANSTWDKGHGTELGLGFTGLPFLSFNLEYRMSTYDKSNAGALSPEFKTKEIVLGVSAPFTLL